MKYTELLLVHGGLLGATYSTHQVSAPGVDLLKQRALEPEERRLSLGSRSNSRSNSVSTSPSRSASQTDTDANNNNPVFRNRYDSIAEDAEGPTNTVSGPRYTSPASTACNSRSNTTSQDDSFNPDSRTIFDNTTFPPDLQRRDSPSTLPSSMSAAMCGTLDAEPQTGRTEKRRSSSRGFNVMRAWTGSGSNNHTNSDDRGHSRENSRSRPISWRTTSMK